MSRLIEALGDYTKVTVDGDHKTKEVSFKAADGSTVIINDKNEIKIVRPERYFLGILWGCVEPSLSEPFDTEEERDAELRRMLDSKHENSVSPEDAYFRVNVNSDGTVEILPYFDSEIDGWLSGEG